MIQIKHLDGTTVLELEIPEGALVHRELMGGHYISLKFTLATPVYLLLGDYVETNFGRFELTEPYSPKYDVETGGYNYDFQLDAHYIKWKNKVCRYNPQNAASETSFNLTANIATHLQVILSTINALGALDTNFLYNGSQFTYQLQGFEGDEKTAKYKQYQNTDIISALNDLASVFDSEWWVEDNIIYFGRCELSGTAETFKIDDNVHEMTSSESSNEYATRLFVFGSDKNLPSNYRKDESADITKNGVVQKRLMLPLASCPYGYLQDSSIIRETEAVEGVYIDEDIYPKVECKVSEVTSYEKTVEDEDTGESTTQTFYRVKDGSGFNFSSDYILEGETLHIIFQSGKMSGMDFECQYNDSEKYYEVVANEDYGRTLPDTSLHPEVGDEFVLYNWDATKLESTGIIATAESELLTAAQKKLAKLKVDPNTYTCKMDSFWYEKNRSSNASDYSHYSMGQKVKLINASCFSSARSSRIIGYEIKLDLEYDTPEYYVGEATVYSQSKDLQNQIDSITVNGASYIVNSGSGGSSAIYLIKTVDAAVESDTNAYSAARVKKQFADKLHDENISALWTLLKGLISKGDLYVGDFISGAFGKGALINSSGHAEVESLYSRSFISTPEFRFNRISVTEGENWCTNGYGTILDVDTENQIITLKLEENDYASVRLGDICRGIYNDLDSEYTTVDSSADECGFSTKKGFFTSYFYICEIITNVKGECKFKYQLRNSSTPHPCKFMKFAQYGSFTDEDRQSSSYSTSIGHAYEEVLEGVNTWIISDSMIVYRHGWLGTMQVHLKSGDTATLQGNGLYVQDNVYFGNAIVQLDPVSLTDIQQQLKQYSVEFSDYTDVITVDDVGNVIGGLYKVDRDEEGNITQKYDYRIHSAIYVKRGNDFLTLAADGEDAGTGTYKIYTQCDGCECEVVNSTLRITKINDVKDGIAGTADDDTFDYDAMRDRSGILVTVTIDCEGIGTISRAFPVAIKHDSQPYVRADLDNEFSGVSWNTKTQSYVGLPLTFNFKMWRNNDMLTVDSLAITGLDSAHYAVSTETDESGAKYKKVTINSLPTDMAEVLNLNVTGSATYSGISYERTLVHTINKSTDLNVYTLLPSVTSVHLDQFKAKSANAVTCKVICNSTENKTWEVASTDFATHGLALKYQVLKTDGTTTEEADYPTGGISVDTDQATIRFILYVTKNSDTTKITEDIPVLLDGVDGRGVEYVFFCQDSETKPTLYDDSTTEGFQKDDYCPYTDAAHTDQWTDEPTGVGANSKYEYYAQRKKVNGVWQAFSDVKMWDRYPVDGTSPYVLDLSNDQALINCDTDGTVLGSYETSEIMLFEGATDAFDKFNIAVTATNISCTRNGKVLNPSAITSDSATIAVKATLKTNTSIVLTAVYKINKTYKGKDGVIYSLVPSISTIHKDGDGNFIDTTMAMQVKKTVGTTSTLLSSATEISNAGLTIKYDSTTISDPTSINTSTVCGSKTYAQFYLYQGSTVIDRERINVVNNGEKGDAGVTINVSNLNINAKKSTSAQQFYVRVKVNLGADAKQYGSGSDQFTCSSLSSVSGLTFATDTIDSSYTFRYKISLAANTIVNADMDFTVTYNGITYTFTIHFTTVADGASVTGPSGATIRPRGIWSSTEDYVCDDEYIDVVVYNNVYYKCLQNNGPSTSVGYETPGTELASDSWEQSSEIDFVASDLIMSENIVSNIVQATKGYFNQIIGQDSDGNETMRVDGNSGTIRAGKDGGQRVELVPSEKSMEIFDSSGNKVATFSGNSSTISALTPGASSSSTPVSSLGVSFSQENNVDDAPVTLRKDLNTTITLANSCRLQTLIATNSTESIDIQITNKAHAYSSSSSSVMMQIYAYMRPRLVAVDSSGNVTTLLYLQSIYAEDSGITSVKNASTITSKASIAAGTYSLYLYVDVYSYGVSDYIKYASDGITYNVSMTITNITVITYGSNSEYMANGLFHSYDSQNYFGGMMESGCMHWEMRSGNYGRKLDYSGMWAMCGSTWFKQPVTVFAARLVYNTSSSTFSIYNYFCGSATISNSSDQTGDTSLTGFNVKITLANSLGCTESNSLVQCTVCSCRKTSGNLTSIVARFYVTDVIHVQIADDDSKNPEDFYIEVKRYTN